MVLTVVLDVCSCWRCVAHCADSSTVVKWMLFEGCGLIGTGTELSLC